MPIQKSSSVVSQAKKQKEYEETEEAQKRKREGNEYIRRREKLAAEAGISSKAAAKLLIPEEEEKMQEILSLQKELEKQRLTKEAEEELSKPNLVNVPTGAVDEFGNPKIVQIPVQNLPVTNEKKINPFDVAIATGSAIGAAGIGGKIGGAIGTTITPGVGTAVGYAVGAAAGTAAFLGKIALDEHQNVKELKESFGGIKTNFDTISNEVKVNPAYREQALIDWQTEKENLYRIEQILKKKTQSNLFEFLGDPGDEYEEVEAYMRIFDIKEQEFIRNYANIA